MIKIVSNTSLIIGLSALGLLHLRWEMFEQYISMEVYKITSSLIIDQKLKNYR